MRKFSISLVSAVFVLAGCSAFGSDDPQPAADPAAPPPDRSTDNATPPPVNAPPTDGVFVSSSKGDDLNEGIDAARPMRSLTAAFKRAQERQLRVYACAEVFSESLDLVDGVSAYGGYDCATAAWKKVDARTTVQSPTVPAVIARSLKKATRLDGFEVIAPDGAGTSPTSIGAEVHDTQLLTFANDVFRSGKGLAGVDGVEPAADAQQEKSTTRNGVPGSPQGSCGDIPDAVCQRYLSNGTLVYFALGGVGGTSSCLLGASGGKGGQGGRGGVFHKGTTPAADFNAAGSGGTAETATGGASLKGGSYGAVGANGANGANGVWSFTAADGFVPGHGTAGVLGAAGQGGGGGGGIRTYCNNDYIDGTFQMPCSVLNPAAALSLHAGTGSGGGAGGCGGAPGTAGTGGGASIGLLLVDSPIALENVVIQSGEGGRAGRGTLGMDGLAGGLGGAYVNWGAAGGFGGAGGHAGLSGHGAPGPSFALVVHGAAPQRKDVTLGAGSPGAGWPELKAGSQTLDAVVGEAKQEYSF